jgi:hypothetical protein
MSRIAIINILAVLVLLATVMFAAQDGPFAASVDRTTVAVGEQFELTFTLNGTTGGDNFQPPPLNDFLVASGPNSSTNMQIINGAVSSSVSYNYVLQPKAEGKFTIGPASINVKGKTEKSQPIVITVVKGSQQAAKQNRQVAEGDVSKQIGDNLLLKVAVEKTRLFQGEQLTAVYKLYFRVGIANYNLTKLPSLAGFWSENLDLPKQQQITNESFNGKQYRVAILKKVALFPQRSGTLELDPMEMTCVVQVQARRQQNNLFDQFFNDPFFGGVTNVNYVVRSEPLKIIVDPLPSQNVPAGFNGAVGKFSMEAWLEKKQVKTNDPVTLRIKISGRGNLKLLQPPDISFPPDLDKYDPKIADNISNQGNVISGSRTFEYLLIPRHAGEQKIPPFQFAYFDLDKRSYVSSTSPEFTIAVEKGAEYASSTVSGLGKEDVKLLGEDIRFIKSGGVTLRRTGEGFSGTVGFYAFASGPVLAFLGFMFFARRRERMMSDTVGLRNRRARKVSLRRLKLAKEFLDQKKKEEFYTEVSRALWGYLSDKLRIPPSDLSIDGVREILSKRSVPEEKTGKVIATIEQCEFARFAPMTDAVEMGTMYEGTVDLISSLEDRLR